MSSIYLSLYILVDKSTKSLLVHVSLTLKYKFTDTTFDFNNVLGNVEINII